ncbi:MAG: rimL [Clostridia bacterium]|jgi:RimJ/RimL family protein N-acetyltransferase|nr:rimL [Clostridia bacterium]
MIHGKLINLRAVKQSDLDELIVLQSDVVERGEFLNPNIVNEVLFKKNYQETGFMNEEFGRLLITDKNGKLLGDIAYFKGVGYLPGYEIGYNMFKREDRGKGYTSEALKLFAAYLFEVKTIHRLEVHADKDNIGSRRVAEKSGFTFEGIKRQAVFSRGKYCDLAIYSLLRDECPSFTEMIKDK